MTDLTTVISRLRRNWGDRSSGIAPPKWRSCVWGIELGEHSLCAVQVRGGLGPNGVVRALLRQPGKEARFGDPKSLSAWVDSLKDIRSKTPWHDQEVVTSLPGHVIDTIPLTLELTGSQTLEDELIRLAGERLTYPLSEAVADYLAVDDLDDGPGPKRVILVAARRTQVDFALELLDRVGLHPLAIELAVTALARLHRATHHESASTGSLVVSPGDTSTSMAFVRQGKTMVTRVIPWGLYPSTSVLQNALGVPLREALSLLSLYQYSPARSSARSSPEDRVRRVVTELMTPLLEELAEEVAKVWAYARTEFRQHPPTDICLAGGAAMIPAIAPFLAEHLDQPVSLIDPTRRYRWWELRPGVENGISPVFFAVAAGLAMRTDPCLAMN